ncbi:MAG TPA: RNA methyltransferase [Candidatus Obscuribacter sp.]|nr:RNA methyltransferase [Candidatus Obscuribacter sp.]HMY51596.1 RNA methyltransferase [Candidatus Obscuribacter sp.]
MDELTVVPDVLFRELVTTTSPSPVLAAAAMPVVTIEMLLARQAATLVLCENLQDPGNLGTIIRSALAFDAGALILSHGSVDAFNPKVVRSAMGGLFQLPILSIDLEIACRHLKEAGYVFLAFSPEAKITTADYPFTEEKVILLVGNEGNGLTERAEALADVKISIPQNPAVESLNVAVATSIALYARAMAQKR